MTTTTTDTNTTTRTDDGTPRPGASTPAAKPAAKPATVYKPVHVGEKLVKDVADLHGKLSSLAGEHDFKVGELKDFGLGFDVFDPQSGTLLSPARPARRDLGHPPVLMAPEAVVSDIVSARQHHVTRAAAAAGIAPPQTPPAKPTIPPGRSDVARD